MKVFLCEKPAQARDIAAVLGTPGRADGYLKVGDVAVTWCIGHLYAQADPDDYDPAYRYWSLDHLPIVPEKWQLKPRERVGRQIKAIRGLLRQADEVVIATDPDREGEVIAREVLDELRYRGRVRRLLLSALDPASIRKGLDSIRDGSETERLYLAGLGRSRADWLVGMNLTRAWTLVGRSRGWEGVLSVGRVQTPTLSLVVERDARIENFTPTDHYTVEATCTHPDNDPFRASWIPNAAQKDALCDGEGRCIERTGAAAVAEVLKGGRGTVDDARRETQREKPPLPYSLSELQQVASKRWGCGAKETLEIVQSLYEKHKAVTYPRTDCRHLPQDQHAEAGAVISGLKATFSGEDSSRMFDGIDIELRSPAWNDSKVTAHHGMIPTARSARLESMSGSERNLFREIAVRYLMQFRPEHVYELTTLKIRVGDNLLQARGRKTVIAGWKALAVSSDEDKPAPAVPFIARGESVGIAEAEVADRKTRPPAPYTEGTLIRAMTRIAAEVEDPDIRAVLREHDGIGTEATRADIIQTLKSRGYVEARKKSLRSTIKGRDLVAALPKELKDPATTALMERMLTEVAEGKSTLEGFMDRQSRFVTGLVEAARRQSGGAAGAGSGQVAHRGPPSGGPGGAADDQGDEPLGSCPECGKRLRRRSGKFGPFVGCSGYPECGYIRKRQGGSAKPARKTGRDCEKCGRAMVVRKGKRGPFLGCSGYPECTNTAQAGR